MIDRRAFLAFASAFVAATARVFGIPWPTTRLTRYKGHKLRHGRFDARTHGANAFDVVVEKADTFKSLWMCVAVDTVEQWADVLLPESVMIPESRVARIPFAHGYVGDSSEPVDFSQFRHAPVVYRYRPMAGQRILVVDLPDPGARHSLFSPHSTISLFGSPEQHNLTRFVRPPGGDAYLLAYGCGLTWDKDLEMWRVPDEVIAKAQARVGPVLRETIGGSVGHTKALLRVPFA